MVLRRVAALLFVTLCAATPAAGPAAAQPVPPAEPAPPPSAEGPERFRALADLLRDGAARDALIAELEALAAAGGAAEGAAPGEGGRPSFADATQRTTETPPHVAVPPDLPTEGDLLVQALEVEASLAGRLAVYVAETLEEVAEGGQAFLNGLGATERRLLALSRGDNPQRLLGIASGLLSVVVVTVVVYFLLRRALRPVLRGLTGVGSDADARADRGLLRAGLLSLAALAVDLLAVALSWGIGYVLSFAVFSPVGEMTIYQSMYLNAFLVVETVKAAIAGLLAPRGDRLRFAPLSNGGARYWAGRLGGLATLLGYGLMLIAPVISTSVSIFTGRAVAVLVYALALLWAIALVVRHRKAPLLWLGGRFQAEGADVTLRILSAIALVWHWPALLWLLSLFVIAVSRSGAVAPMLTVSAQAAGILAAGGVVSTLLARGARRGVRCPDSVREVLPLLEGRVNGFLLRFLSVLRFVIFLLAVSLSLRIAGVVDLRAALSRQLGTDLVLTLFDVALTALMAFVVWLAVVSWVDWRLSPKEGVAADPREQTLLSLLRNAATVVVAVVAGMSILSTMGLDIAPLIASAGVVGLAIGFGAQRLVQDVITGIFIQFENAINVGDVVTVAGISGVVEKLTIRSVSLRDLSGVFHVVPFSSVDMVSNFNRGFAFHVADLGVAYDTDMETAKKAIFAAFDDTRADPAFGGQIIGPLDWQGVVTFGDSAITLRSRIRTRPGAQWAVGRAFNERVKRRFDEAGVEIPFPQSTLWVREMPAPPAPPPQVQREPAPAAP